MKITFFHLQNVFKKEKKHIVYRYIHRWWKYEERQMANLRILQDTYFLWLDYSDSEREMIGRISSLPKKKKKKSVTLMAFTLQQK